MTKETAFHIATMTKVWTHRGFLTGINEGL